MYVHFYTLEIRPTHHKMADEGNLSGNMQKKASLWVGKKKFLKFPCVFIIGKKFQKIAYEKTDIHVFPLLFLNNI